MTRMMTSAEITAARAGQRSQERRPETADVYLLARQMQSQAIANATAAVVKGLFRLTAGAVRPLVRGVRRAHARRRTLAELSTLDARGLRDIGIDPYNVEGAVDALFAEQSAQHEGGLRHWTRGLRRWNLSRQTAGEMARMNGETLNDLGYVKGDVDWVPETLAEQRLNANRNQADGRKAA